MSVYPLTLGERQDDYYDWVPSTDPYPEYPNADRKWARRYTWLRDAYLGRAYSDEDVKALSLFQAEDENGNTIAVTDRIFRDIQHVVDTDVLALDRRLSLDTARSAPAGDWRTRGERIWRRSSIQRVLTDAAQPYCMLGDVLLEAVPSRTGAYIIAHEPHTYVGGLTYSDDHRTLLSAEITTSGLNDDGQLRVFKRLVTADSTTTWEVDPYARSDRRNVQEYEHRLGFAPLAHPKFQPFASPYHGLSAQHALHRPIAKVDELIAQITAISRRTSNPILALLGIDVDDADAGGLQMLGRILVGGRGFDGTTQDAKYVEPVFGAIQAAWQVTTELLKETRATVPEFLFAGSGANTSGYALDVRADQFKRKAEGFRSRLYGAIADCTQYASLMDDGATYDPDDTIYRILAPGVLPLDRVSHAGLLETADRMGAIRKADIVRQLQALDLIDPEEDPEAYAQALLDESGGGGDRSTREDPAGAPADGAGA